MVGACRARGNGSQCDSANPIDISIPAAAKIERLKNRETESEIEVRPTITRVATLPMGGGRHKQLMMIHHQDQF